MIKKTTLLLVMLSALAFLFQACDEIIDDDDPTVDPREKFLGQWETTETSTLYPQPITFMMDIQEDVNSAQIRLYNIYQLGPNMYVDAVVTGDNFTIPQQTVDNLDVEGFGQLVNDNTIEIEYTVNDGADLDNVVGTMTNNAVSFPGPYLAFSGT
ncbi:MAG: hypothetical protein ACQESZ_03120 [Bacteroidota bacterium]